MHLNLSHPRALRRAFTALALLAALFTGLMPAGWMPHAAADGAYTLTICTGEGTQELTFDANGNRIDGESGETAGPAITCPFASLAFTGVLPAMPFVLARAAGTVSAPATTAHKGMAEAAYRPGPRAPPANPELMTQIA